jgi:predicted Ser/Thr protein kinase
MSRADIDDEALADCLEDHHRRRARGEPDVDDGYASRLSPEGREEFRRILATERALDALLEPPASEVLPRAFGSYTLLRELGRGAMGVVYEAMHRDLGRKVALKVLRAGVDLDADARARFKREARACAQVRHRHIVEIYEAGEVDGRPYYAMELVVGRPLSETARETRPDSRTLFRGIAGVADALAALHAAGIVHRDVKPSNIVVAADGRMILADFGLARSVSAERLTRTGQAIGTPLYMSPEQVLGRADEIDGRSDVYSLGATLYEALAGRGPFRSDDPIAMLRMILRERPDQLADVAPDVPREACDVVMKAMEKRPQDRYAGAAQMRDDLLAHADGRRVAGHPVSPLRHALRTALRWSPAAAVAAALVGVGLYVHATRPGRLTVRSVPSAEVVVDGVSYGASPQVDLSIAPGEHRLELVKTGWRAAPTPFTVEAGGTPTFQLVMLPENPDDPAALRMLGAEIGIAMADVAVAPPRARVEDTAPAPVVAVFPRGKVRLSDLDRMRVDVKDVLPAGGTLGLWKDGALVASLPFASDKPVNEIDFPDAARKALAAGDVASWGYAAPSGERFTTTIQIVGEDTASEKLRRVARLCGTKPTLVRCHLTTQALLDAGLDYAAYRVAAAAAKDAPKSERAWTMMEMALDRLGLEGTKPWLEARKRIAR